MNTYLGFYTIRDQMHKRMTEVNLWEEDLKYYTNKGLTLKQAKKTSYKNRWRAARNLVWR